MTASETVTTITEHEAGQVERANASALTPVVFVHGLWLLPSSWDRWAEVFEAAGYVALTPGWPDDPAEASEQPGHQILDDLAAEAETAVRAEMSSCPGH